MSSKQANSGQWLGRKLRLRDSAPWLPTRVLTCLCLALLVLPSFAQQTNSASRLDYSEFRIISDRNIFNTRRYARATSRRDSRPSARTESFALVGTMSYEKGPFAFFEGSSSDYQKVLKPSDKIANYTVTEIQPSFVKLNSGTNEVQLRVGMQLRREEQGEWQMSERIEPTPSTSERTPERSSVAATQPANPPATPGNGGASPFPGQGPFPGEPPIIVVDGDALTIPLGEGGVPPPGLGEQPQVRPLNEAVQPGSPDEVLRRLMERRRQEDNQ